jgi:hypothetical protein
MVCAVLAVCTVVVTGAGYAQQSRDPAALVAKVNGAVFVVRGDGRAKAVQYMPLYIADRLETGPKSSVEILFDTGINLRIEENCSVELASLMLGRTPKKSVKSVSMEVNVKTGGVLVDGATIKNKYQLQSMKVRTPTSVAAIRGTVFYAGVAGDGSGKVAVFEGAVQAYRTDRDETSGVAVVAGRQAVIGFSDDVPSVGGFDDETRAYGLSVVEEYRKAVAYYRRQLDAFKKQRDLWIREHKDAFMREIERDKRDFMQKREGSGDDKIKRIMNDPDLR